MQLPYDFVLTPHCEIDIFKLLLIYLLLSQKHNYVAQLYIWIFVRYPSDKCEIITIRKAFEKDNRGAIYLIFNTLCNCGEEWFSFPFFSLWLSVYNNKKCSVIQFLYQTAQYCTIELHSAWTSLDFRIILFFFIIIWV